MSESKSMYPDLERWIGALRGAGLDLDALDIADAFWLARHLPPPREETTAGGPPPDKPTSEEIKLPSPVEAAALETNPSLPSKPAEPECTRDLYPRGPEARAGRTVVLPDAAALPQKLQLGRALRPLRRRVDSRTRLELDEASTAHHAARLRIAWRDAPLVPVLRPTRARWLDAVLLIDRSQTMAIWRRMLEEWETLLHRLGAFRNVRVWHMLPGKGDKGPELASPADATRSWIARDAAELNEVRSRRLVLIATDCIAPLWQSQSIRAFLAEQAKAGPLALLQMLPPHLWSRTALGRLERYSLQSASPGAPAHRLAATPVDVDDADDAARAEVPPIPVVTLEPEALAAWARLLVGHPEGSAAGFRFEAAQPSPAGAATGRARLPVGDIVDRFLGASPTARKLAAYLAAVPLTMPVIRIVQHTLVPEARSEHLVEVITSGLVVQRLPDVWRGTPDDEMYDFIPGARERLLAALGVSEIESIARRIGAYFAKARGAEYNFAAVLDDGTAEAPGAAPRRPFASVSEALFAVTRSSRLAPRQPVPRPPEQRPSEEPLAPTRAGVIGLEYGAAVLIGIGHYESGLIQHLPDAVRRAQAMASALVDGGYDPEGVHVLLNEAATREGIARAILEATRAHPRGTLVVFFSGHSMYLSGHALSSERESPIHLVTSTYSERSLVAGLIPAHEVVAGVPARWNVILILDTYFSAGVTAYFPPRLSAPHAGARVLLSAGFDRDVSPVEENAPANKEFAAALLRALSAATARRGDVVGVRELFALMRSDLSSRGASWQPELSIIGASDVAIIRGRALREWSRACALILAGKQHLTGYLVAPHLVVTCAATLTQQPRGEHGEVHVQLDGSEYRARVVAAVEDGDCVLLGLDAPVPGVEPLRPSPVVETGAAWEAIVMRPGKPLAETRWYSGTVESPASPATFESRLLLRSETVVERGAAGAPVMVEKRLVGHLVRSEGGLLYQALASTAVIRVLDQVLERDADLITWVIALAEAPVHPRFEVEAIEVFRRLAGAERSRLGSRMDGAAHLRVRSTEAVFNAVMQLWRAGSLSELLGMRIRWIAQDSPPRDDADPQKGVWGGLPERNGRLLSAEIERVKEGRHRVRLVVEGMPGAPQLEGDVVFHLHPTFARTEERIAVKRGRAVLTLLVWGWFVVGAECDEGRTRLELDLGDVPKQALDFFDEMAASYEEIRSRASGPARTRNMNALIDDVAQEARRRHVDGDFVLRFYRTGRDGARVVALACCRAMPEIAPGSVIADAIRAPRTPFEQWTAVLAAQSTVLAASPLASEACVSALLEQLEDPESLLNQPHDPSRRLLTPPILAAFAQRVGLRGTDDPAALRRWIDAGAGHQGKGRRVVVLGSDAAGEHIDVCRALGERLAAHGWSVIAGNGANVGAEVVNGFRRAGPSSAEATLYRTADFANLTAMRRHLIMEAVCAIAIGGGAGTWQECTMAMQRGLPVVAVAFTGGAARAVSGKLHEELMARGVPAELLALLDLRAEATITGERIVRVLNVACTGSLPA
ncbi:SAV_2336 N-terminal domain-related protein [Sorangium sp. So ce385]|uniref:SAV_2336 N-terminal domain-related protein n=1 Tax=Sorangium sp. So ce385 TaxID=3133308 RepID=UPI003F5B9787